MASSSTQTDLQRYPRPSLAIDVALLTVVPGYRPHLGVVLVRHRNGDGGPGWCLPGTFVHEGERLADAVRRVLRDKAGLSGVDPRQLHVFDDPARDPRGWVVTVAHADTIRAEDVDTHRSSDHDVTVAPVEGTGASARAQLPDRQRTLPYDHAEILSVATEDLRRRYAEAPDPAGLLPEPFTLLQLRQVHEAVGGRPLQKDTFRRRMEPHLIATDDRTTGTTGRPAQLFRRADSRAQSPEAPEGRAQP